MSGRLLAPAAAHELMLGAKAARDLGAQVGSNVTLDRASFVVVGIYRVADGWRDAGAIVPLDTVQELAGKRDVVTAVHVKVAAGRSADDDRAGLPPARGDRRPDDYGEVDQGFKILDAVNLAISLLAVGIGAIGVMNTMIMSVFERTREIGILRAVGWRGSRIIRMITLESLFLCLLAAVVGVGFGVLASRAVLLVPAVSSFLTPGYAPEVFLRALGVGVVVALVGAVYPALRAVRLSPLEALRHE